MTFSLTIRTPETITAETAAARLAAAKAECRRRILAVANETAQMNLFGAVGAGLLSPAQMEVYTAGVLWVAAMRAACATAATAPDLSDDGYWPPVPDGVVDLAKLF